MEQQKLYNLSLLMQQKGITQLNLSTKIEVSQETISAYLNGKAKPSVATLIKIADFFDTTTDYILGRTDVNITVNDIKPADISEEEFSLIHTVRRLTSKDKERLSGYLDGLQQK
ncbi:MAG: helix-turn-helix domain-containing protein [Coprobacillaceae bacterium]